MIRSRAGNDKGRVRVDKGSALAVALRCVGSQNRFASNRGRDFEFELGVLGSRAGIQNKGMQASYVEAIVCGNLSVCGKVMQQALLAQQVELVDG